MKTTSLFWLLLCICLVSACRDEAQAPGQENPTPTPDSPYESRYYHMTGEVDDLPVTFNLTTAKSRYEEGTYFGGYYYYDRYQQPINFYGSIDSAGQLVLTEQIGMSDEPNYFRGEWTEDGYYRGKWSMGDGSRELDFELRPAGGDNHITFELLPLSDSITAMPTWTQSPAASFHMDRLVPVTDDAALRDFLQGAILAGFVGDSLAGIYKNLETAAEKEKQNYFENYRNEFTEMYREGQIDTTEEAYAFNYEVSYSMDVLYNTPRLLTLGYSHYMYSGGAHGNYYTTIQSYDLVNRRRIELKNVLKPGAEGRLTPALAQAVRDRYHIGKDEALTEILFEDQIAPNENFGLTGKGILFMYAPYEVAPYAAGQIELFIPFESIRDLLQPEFLQFIESATPQQQ